MIKKIHSDENSTTQICNEGWRGRKVLFLYAGTERSAMIHVVLSLLTSRLIKTECFTRDH